MKQRILKWAIRLTASFAVLAACVIALVLYPSILFADRTDIGNFTVYHNAPLDAHFREQLDSAAALLKTSELYDSSATLNVCINDGSLYQTLIRTLGGPAFAWGFYDKVVLMGEAHAGENYVELNGCRWNMASLLAHEATHCMQFRRFGMWRSNPIARYPSWKWEGFPEYVARNCGGEKNLIRNIEQLRSADRDAWGIAFGDSTIAPADYYGAMLLVQYALEIKKLSYRALLADTSSEETLRDEMMSWYERQSR